MISNMCMSYVESIPVVRVLSFTVMLVTFEPVTVPSNVIASVTPVNSSPFSFLRLLSVMPLMFLISAMAMPFTFLLR